MGGIHASLVPGRSRALRGRALHRRVRSALARGDRRRRSAASSSRVYDGGTTRRIAAPAGSLDLREVHATSTCRRRPRAAARWTARSARSPCSTAACSACATSTTSSPRSRAIAGARHHLRGRRPERLLAQGEGALHGRCSARWPTRSSNKQWITQVTINFGDDDELPALARASGCAGVFIGLESTDTKSLALIRKDGMSQRRGLDYYRENVARIRRQGIGVVGSFILGIDTQNMDTIVSDILAFAEETELDGLNPTILTPLPGTRDYARYDADGRILFKNYPDDWEKYTLAFPGDEHAERHRRRPDAALLAGAAVLPARAHRRRVYWRTHDHVSPEAAWHTFLWNRVWTNYCLSRGLYRDSPLAALYPAEVPRDSSRSDPSLTAGTIPRVRARPSGRSRRCCKADPLARAIDRAHETFRVQFRPGASCRTSARRRIARRHRRRPRARRSTTRRHAPRRVRAAERRGETAAGCRRPSAARDGRRRTSRRIARGTVRRHHDRARRIVDVDQRERGVGRRDEQETAARGQAEQLQESAIARAVDRRRAQDRPRHARVGADVRFRGELAAPVRRDRMRRVVLARGIAPACRGRAPPGSR